MIIVVSSVVSSLIFSLIFSTFLSHLAQAKSDAEPKVYRAKAFILEDDKGNNRGGLFLDEGCPYFSLIDENGRIRLAVALSKLNEPSICMFSKERKPRLCLVMQDGNPSITLFHANEKHAIEMAVGGEGNHAEIRANAATTKTSARVSVSDDKAHLSTFNSKGHLKTSMSLSPRLGASISVLDEGDNTGVILSSTKKLGNMIFISKKGREEVFIAGARKDGSWMRLGNMKKVALEGIYMNYKDSLGFLHLGHEKGASIIGSFSHSGEPYMGIQTSKKRLWSAPDPPPAGVPLKPKK
jgi:hypothetical protein